MRMQEKTARAYGTDVHYLEGGDGPPLLLIHGIAECKESWAANLEFLAQHFHIYVPDVIGWGATEPSPEHDFTVPSLGRFTVAFMDAVGLERTHVIGWSLGGANTLWAMLDAPDRFDRALLIAPAGLGREVHWAFRVMQLPLIGELMLWPKYFLAWFRYKVLFTHRKDTITSDYIRTIVRATSQPWHADSLLRLLRRHKPFWTGQADIDISDRLSEFEMPIHILWGRQDRIVPVVHGVAAEKQLKNGQLTIFERCGHLPMIECRPQFHELALRFFKPEQDAAKIHAHKSMSSVKSVG